MYLILHQNACFGSERMSLREILACHSIFYLQRVNQSSGSIWILDIPWALSAQARVARHVLNVQNYFTEIG